MAGTTQAVTKCIQNGFHSVARPFKIFSMIFYILAVLGFIEAHIIDQQSEVNVCDAAQGMEVKLENV